MTGDAGARPLVVVGVDGSEESVQALRWAARYGAATGASVRAVLAWHYPTAASVPPVVVVQYAPTLVFIGEAVDSCVVVGGHSPLRGAWDTPEGSSREFWSEEGVVR